MVGRPLPGNRNDRKAWEESGAEAAIGRTLTIADGGCPGTGLVMPHRRRKGEDLPDRKEAHNKSYKQVRARVEHVFAHMKTCKTLRHCRLGSDGVHHAMPGTARVHHLTLAGQTRGSYDGQALPRQLGDHLRNSFQPGVCRPYGLLLCAEASEQEERR